MGDVVNLNRFRKARTRAERVKEAQENRIRHGRPKSDSVRDKREQDRSRLDHDGKKLED